MWQLPIKWAKNNLIFNTNKVIKILIAQCILKFSFRFVYYSTLFVNSIILYIKQNLQLFNLLVKSNTVHNIQKNFKFFLYILYTWYKKQNRQFSSCPQKQNILQNDRQVKSLHDMTARRLSLRYIEGILDIQFVV